jgi:DNA repair photolyase
VTTAVPILTPKQVRALPRRAREVVEYRKSGLSLNHIQGCPLDCAYCIRHTYGLWDQRQPRALLSDEEAVEQLIGHRYFMPHVTPLQLFNRATDPFLPQVKKHTFAVVANLEQRGLRNHMLIITRYRITDRDCEQLAATRHLRLTLLLTYSGIEDRRIEPYPSSVAAESLQTASRRAPRCYRTVLYWRPLVPGLNDSPEHLAQAAELSRSGDATVFTGLFLREEIAAYYRAHDLPLPYDETARRKIMPETTEQRVLAAFREHGGGPLFRKTSCAVSYAHGLPDYNGHIGIRELCDICPLAQLALCESAHQVPTSTQVADAAGALPELRELRVMDITPRAMVVSGLASEQPRYYLQHALGFQVHDAARPHRPRRHGRAEIGWEQP